MQLDMGVGGLAGVVLGSFVMGMGEMGVMSARLMIALGDMSGGFAMMLRRAFMMFCGLFVMFGGVLGVRHGRLPFIGRILRTALNSVILRQIRDEDAQKSLANLSQVNSGSCANAPTSSLSN
jgi:ascorbate-specific PTS system EIIC-type component UlaA